MDPNEQGTAEDVLLDFDADDDEEDIEIHHDNLPEESTVNDGGIASLGEKANGIHGNGNITISSEPMIPAVSDTVAFIDADSKPFPLNPTATSSSLVSNPMDKPLSSSRHDKMNMRQSTTLRTHTGKSTNANTNNLTSGSATFGVYIPPFRRKQLEKEQAQQQAQQNSLGTPTTSTMTQSAPAMLPQRQKWEQLKKTINGTINRLNSQTIKDLIHSLFQNANLIRGKGLLAKAILRAATTSPTYAPVYVSLIAVVNTKLPEIGELILVRSILMFRRSYARQDRGVTMAITNFMGCLFNQGLCHELLCLQLLTVLLEDPTDDSVDIAVQFTKVVGMTLVESSPAGVHAVMERFRSLLHDGRIGRRVQYKIEELMKVRKNKFQDFSALNEDLDLVEREEQITFEIGLDDEGLQKEDHLDVFKYDPDWVQNENDWTEIRREILGEDTDDEDGDGSSETDDSSDADSDEDEEDGILVESTPVAVASTKQIIEIHDMSEKDLINLRRTIYLTIMSSATFEECSHKLSKLDIPDGKEMELINMMIECCSQERTFLRYYGLISARFCLLHKRWSNAFHEAFIAQYSTIHRLETNKLRNVAKLFAHLLHTDSLSWSCMAAIHLNEDETTSSSRIFLKIVVQEMAEAIGIGTLVKRFESDDPETAEWFKELFPKDNPRKTRYAINFFTSIGLGPLTDGLREYLKNAPKLIMMQAEEEARLKAIKDDDSDASSVLSSSSSSSSDISSSSAASSTSSSSSSYSSDSSDNSSSYARGRRRKRPSSGRKGRRRKYSSDSSSTTSTRRSVSSSLSKDRRSKSKRSASRSKKKASRSNREDRSPIGSQVEVKSNARSRSRSFSRSRSASPKNHLPVERKDREKENEHNKSRKRSRSYSSSSSSYSSRRGKREERSRKSRRPARSYSRSVSRSRSADRREKSK